MTKTFVIKRFEPTTSCVRDQDDTTTPPRQVGDRSFKLTPIHASVIYEIVWICWIHWIFVPFRGKSNENARSWPFGEVRFHLGMEVCEAALCMVWTLSDHRVDAQHLTSQYSLPTLDVHCMIVYKWTNVNPEKILISSSILSSRH